MSENKRLALLWLSQVGAFAVLGYWCSDKVASIPDAQLFKVLNVVGLVFDFCGIVLLSRIIATNERYQRLVLEHLAPGIGFFLLGMTIGIMVFSAVGPTGPSSKLVSEVVLRGAFLILMPVVFLLQVIGPESRRVFPLAAGTSIDLVGTALLLGGLLIQLIASILDLQSGK